MTIQIIINDFVGISQEVSYNFIGEVGIEDTRIEVDKTIFQQNVMRIVKIQVPRLLGFKIIENFNLSRAGKCCMILRK